MKAFLSIALNLNRKQSQTATKVVKCALKGKNSKQKHAIVTKREKTFVDPLANA